MNRRPLTAILRDIDTINKAQILTHYKQNALKALNDEIEAGYGQLPLDLGQQPQTPQVPAGQAAKAR